ncbi:MAG: hypothetical protein JWM31_3488 [Solirubrobacterales bacterium]|nr:hypothetical protein [Solirubrobacterales bacterium]
MGTDAPTTQQDKQITVAVPEQRTAEFYAFFARFLAADGPGRRRGPRGRHGHGPVGHRPGCRPQHHEEHHHGAPAAAEAAPAEPAA